MKINKERTDRASKLCHPYWELKFVVPHLEVFDEFVGVKAIPMKGNFINLKES